MAGDHHEGIRPQGVAIANIADTAFVNQLYRGEIVVPVDGNTNKNPIGIFLAQSSPTDADSYLRVLTQYPFVTTITGNTTLSLQHQYINCNSSSALTVTLPPASGIARWFSIKNINTGTVTIDGDGSETIDGATTADLANQWEQVVVYSDGTSWFIGI